MTVQKSLREVLMAHPVVARLSSTDSYRRFRPYWYLCVVFDTVHVRTHLVDSGLGGSGYDSGASTCDILRDDVAEFIYRAVEEQMMALALIVKHHAACENEDDGKKYELTQWARRLGAGVRECRGLRAGRRA